MKIIKMFIGAILLVSLFSLGFAQTLVVEPITTPSDFTVRVTLDKAPNGTFTSEYVAGETASLRVVASRDAFIYLFVQDVNGRVQMNLPNQIDSNNYLRAGETMFFPPNDSYRFRVVGPPGLVRVFVVASQQALPFETQSSFDMEGDFANMTASEQLSATISRIDEMMSQLVIEVDVVSSSTVGWVTNHNAFFVR